LFHGIKSDVLPVPTVAIGRASGKLKTTRSENKMAVCSLTLAVLAEQLSDELLNLLRLLP
jgi:hypothetical protein